MTQLAPNEALHPTLDRCFGCCRSHAPPASAGECSCQAALSVVRNLMLSILVSFFVSACIIYPRPVTVTPAYKGVVRSSSGAPIPNALVEVEGAGRTGATVASEDGAFEVSAQRRLIWLHWFVPPGRWYLFSDCVGTVSASHQDFERTETAFVLEPLVDSVMCEDIEQKLEFALSSSTRVQSTHD